MRPSELPAYLATLRQKVADEGPEKAAYAMARAFHAELSDVTLVQYSHPRGMQTTSPPGQPPAIVGGHLKRSLRLYAAVRTGAYSARSRVVPLIVYARIQELGGTVNASHPGFKLVMGPDGRHRFVQTGMLHWVSDGKHHFAQSVTLPPRPYMRPTHRRMVSDGRLRQAAIDSVRGLVGRG